MTGSRWQAESPSGLDGFAYIPHTAADPGPGEVRVQVRAAGVNPADLKHVARAERFPAPVGYEIAGVVTDVGDGVSNVRIGDRVAAFRVHSGYATELTFPAAKAFTLPDTVDDVVAAGLLLAGTTAADMLERSGAQRGETILVHGASGAVGATVLQLAARRGVAVVGTASPDRLDAVTRFGATALPYGQTLVERLPDVPFAAALDLAGTADAMAASVAVVADRSRIITAANKAAAAEHGAVAVAGMDPQSATYRDAMRRPLLDMVAAAELEVPVAQTFPLTQAREALALVAGGHAGGKVVLTVGR